MKTKFGNGLFESSDDGNIFFTEEGLKEFGPLFVCEPLVETGAKVNARTKLFCVEGLNMLSCIKSPFKNGYVTKVAEWPCPSEIKAGVSIITIKTEGSDALPSL